MPGTPIFASNLFFNGGVSFVQEGDKFGSTDLRA